MRCLLKIDAVDLVKSNFSGKVVDLFECAQEDRKAEIEESQVRQLQRKFVVKGFRRLHCGLER